jgi:endonuclease/exonuclease/phosphatase (EEP) superfamily protein YafD
VSLARETWAQLGALVDRVDGEPLPAVFAGDFNFTPRSAQAGRLRRAGLTEAHALGGRWRGATWPATGAAALSPGIRLDQAYMTGELACVRSRVLGRNGSDHCPIVVDIGVRSD